MNSNSVPAPFGPVYPDLGPKVAKFRKIPRDKLTPEQRRAYAEAIEEAIRAKQRQALQRQLPSFAPHCASGTWHTTGEAIHEAVRQQQRNELLAYPAKVRKARAPVEWARMYKQAMKEKALHMSAETKAAA